MWMQGAFKLGEEQVIHEGRRGSSISLVWTLAGGGGFTTTEQLCRQEHTDVFEPSSFSCSCYFY